MPEQDGAIIEVNALPGFQGALFPAEGQPRQVGRPIVDMLFPAGTPSRIPLIAILGSPGTEGLGARVVSICEAAGQMVGLSTPQGASVSGLRLEPGDSSQQAGTCALLLHPLLESLVVETTPETVLEQGLPFDRCDIAIVTVDDPNGTARVLEQTLDPAGTLILNADARGLTVNVGDGQSVIYTSDGRESAAVDRHRERGERCVLARDGRVVVAEGAHETEVVTIRDETPAGGVAPMLSAVAAGWAAGFPPHVIAQALAAVVRR
jgi:cyanophycin synthetase